MKKSKSRKVFDILNYFFMGVLLITIIYPFLNQIAISFSSTEALVLGNVTWYPKEFALSSYKELMGQKIFWVNYRNTVIYTFSGTAIALSLTTMCAYALSKENLWGRGVILKLIVFTMFFSGGLVPGFVLIRELGLLDNPLSVLLPGAILPYHVLIMKTYFASLPPELEDAGKIDGLGQFGYFTKVVLPLSKPIIATMILFIAVIYWNDWFGALLFLNRPEQQPVSLYLRNVLMGAFSTAQQGNVDAQSTKIVPESLQAASMLLVTIPVLTIYPFIQKHFVKGVMIGSIKG